MGVKETPIGDKEPDEAAEEEGPEEAEEEREEEREEEKEEEKEESKIEEEPQILEAKPKRKAKAKPEKKPEKAKPAKKKETVDLKQRTMCPICKTNMSNHALLYTHSCTKDALEKKKQAPTYEAPEEKEVPPMPVLERQPLSYREILAREQAELRRHKAARIVNPIRAHFFGRL